LFGNKVNQKKIVESSRKSWPKGLAKFNFGWIWHFRKLFQWRKLIIFQTEFDEGQILEIGATINDKTNLI
jgi:hypothetical protein